ncbi:MAG: M23 family metallopeptidase [Myxococcales bacterium]|nr:M23 family metallopeptidase [Myxococcales bacterium]
MRRLAKLLLLLLGLQLLAADRPPWRARKRPEIRPNRLAAMHVSPHDWAPEPAAPAIVEAAAFDGALRKLCGWMRPGRARDYGAWIRRYAGDFGVDPFLLAGLVYRESRCRADREELGGLGLTLIAPRMYQSALQSRRYRYQVSGPGGEWIERERPLPRFPFVRAAMLRPEPNLYFAAALLSVWREQHATVDASFEQVPHRHYVSHWVWGDRVRSARAEDRILTDRRRLLRYYGALPAPEPSEYLGLPLGTPLDGAPRVVSSGLGFERDDGQRSHRGIDLESEFGEPVRSVASGRVVFAGVDLPGRQSNQQLPPAETNEYDRGALGRGGRYVCTLHALPEAGSLRFCYMHLETVEVERGQRIIMGQRLGTVGRTGMKRSAPHLHFEAHLDGTLLNPMQLLREHVVGSPAPFDDHRKRRARRRARAAAKAAALQNPPAQSEPAAGSDLAAR